MADNSDEKPQLAEEEYENVSHRLAASSAGSTSTKSGQPQLHDFNGENRLMFLDLECCAASSGKRESIQISSSKFSETRCDGPNIMDFPDEILLMILSHLSEQDLCHVSQLCTTLNRIANDGELWERLYKDLYGYDLPLMVGPDPNRFYFVETSRNDTAFSKDLWKKSFSTLYRAVHVRPNVGSGNNHSGRALKYFNTIGDALEECYKKYVDSDDVPIILIHPGTYMNEWLTVNVPVNILGCGPGANPAENVVIVNDCSDSCIKFKCNSGSSYLGYVTLNSNCKEEVIELNEEGYRFWEYAYCATISGNLSTIIDHCIIRSKEGNGLDVNEFARPIVRNCDISDIKSIAIDIKIFAGGLYEGNKILRCLRAFRLDEEVKPTVRQNHIQGCLMIGMVTTDGGLTYQRVPW